MPAPALAEQMPTAHAPLRPPILRGLANESWFICPKPRQAAPSLFHFTKLRRRCADRRKRSADLLKLSANLLKRSASLLNHAANLRKYFVGGRTPPPPCARPVKLAKPFRKSAEALCKFAEWFRKEAERLSKFAKRFSSLTKRLLQSAPCLRHASGLVGTARPQTAVV